MARLDARIAVADRDGTRRLLTKIVGLSDGGFAVTAPYHAERRGFLFKFPVDYSQKLQQLPFADVVPYTADDRVKLSLHLDGFVQFSGERPGRIVSGRNADGSPKGLGLVANRLTTPLSTGGPTFGLTAWGLDRFEQPRPGREVLAFEEHDVYYRDCTAHDWNAYLVEGFVYPRSFLGRGLLSNGRLVLPRRFPNYEEIPRESGLILPTRQHLFDQAGALFDLTLIDVGSAYVVVGLLVSRATHDMPSASGFTLSSPSDMRHALMAMYPSPMDGASDDDQRSLNYEPPDAERSVLITYCLRPNTRKSASGPALVYGELSVVRSVERLDAASEATLRGRPRARPAIAEVGEAGSSRSLERPTAPRRGGSPLVLGEACTVRGK